MRTANKPQKQKYLTDNIILLKTELWEESLSGAPSI